MELQSQRLARQSGVVGSCLGGGEEVQVTHHAQSDIAQFLSEHRRRLVAIATAILNDKNEAFDVVQDAVLKYLQHKETLKAEHDVAWLMRVVTNRSLDLLRQRRGQVHCEDFQSYANSVETNPSDSVASSDASGLIRDAMSELPPQQSRVLSLRLNREQTFAAIARDLRISEGATKIHFQRGIASLRRRLAGKLGEV